MENSSLLPASAALCAAAAVLSLSACSTRSSQVTSIPESGTYRSTMPAALAGKLQPYIFATTFSNNTLTEFTLAGAPIRTITIGLDSLQGVTLNSHGKIFVANYLNNTVTTYTYNGRPTTPTITQSLDQPAGVAVDSSGEIYVTNQGNNTLTTYNPDGTQTTPTITKNIDFPGIPFVDAKG